MRRTRARCRGAKRLNGELRVTLDHALLEPGWFPFPPTLHTMRNAVAQGSPVPFGVADGGPRNAYELDLEPVVGRVDDAIPVSAEIQE